MANNNLKEYQNLKDRLIKKDSSQYSFLSQESKEYLQNLNEDVLDEIVKELSLYALEDINSSNPIIIGGMRLFDLLAKYFIKVFIFSFDNKIIPIYLNYGDCNELINLTSDNCKVLKESQILLLDKINNAIKNGISFECDYQMDSQQNQWQRMRAIPLNYQGYKNVFLSIIYDVTNEKKQEEIINLQKSLLNIENEKYHFAFEHSNSFIWEYNIANKELVISSALAKLYGYEKTHLLNAPESVVSSSLVHEKSIVTYNNLYQDIIDGKESGSCIILHKTFEGKFKWIKLTYNNIFDNGKPVKAIGVVEKQENNTDVTSKFEQEKCLFNQLQKSLLLTIQYNLTKDKVSNLYVNKELEYNFIEEDYTYQEFFDKAFLHISSFEEQQKFNSLFNKKQLNEYFDLSISSKHLNYRTIDNKGNIKWTSFTVNFLIEPFTGDRYMFGYVRDIDRKMKLELELDRKVEYDMITRIYIEEVLKKITNYAISHKCNETNRCCFAIIELANLSNLKRIYGLDSAEKILFHIGRIIRISFNNIYIAGRIPENKIGIFIPNVTDEEEIRMLLEDTMSAAINSYTLTDESTHKLKVNISIYESIVQYSNYEKLYSNCVKQLEKLKDSSESINIIDNFEEFNSGQTLEEAIDTDKHNTKVRDIVNNVINNIIVEKDDNHYISYILKTINDFYGSFRASIFINNNDIFELKYENTMGNINTFDEISFDIHKYPGVLFLKRFQKDVIIDDINILKKDYPNEYHSFKENNIYRIMIFPLFEAKTIIGFLTISNATRYATEKDLGSILSHVISNKLEKMKYTEIKDYYKKYDLIANVQNYYSLREKVKDMRHQAISSIGVCCLGINSDNVDLFDNDEDDTNALITIISNNLKRVFDKKCIYRYDKDTFYIIIEDCEYKEFKRKVKMIISAISEMKLKKVNLGFTWSDVDLNIDLLLKHANELMIINNVSANDSDKSIEDKNEGLLKAMKLKWFEVYVQPKFNCSNSSVYGAEALIRINHPRKGIISPAKFIPILEKSKLISKVDLFVFEEVCKILNKWKEENRKLYPISINYSRVTILEAGILNKTINLMKKYHIDPKLIEIEITESVGDLEKETLKTISQSFIDKGIRLSLDDFGAEYSNLNTLANIPFYALKIDKSLINDVVSNKRNKVLIENVALACKGLNVLCVVEGVETELQFEAVKKIGCDIVQGYYFERPITIREFEEKYNFINN